MFYEPFEQLGYLLAIFPEPFELLDYPFAIFPEPFERLGYPFTIFPELFKRLGYPFTIFPEPFEWLGYPFGILNHPFKHSLNPFQKAWWPVCNPFDGRSFHPRKGKLLMHVFAWKVTFCEYFLWLSVNEVNSLAVSSQEIKRFEEKLSICGVKQQLARTCNV